MNSAEAYNWDECKREQMEERGHLLVLSRIPPAGLPLERTILFSPVNIDCKTLDLWIWVSIFFLFCVELLSFPWQIVPSESSNGSSLTLGRQRGSLFNVHTHPLWMVTSSSFSLPFLIQSFKKKKTQSKQTKKALRVKRLKKCCSSLALAQLPEVALDTSRKRGHGQLSHLWLLHQPES